MERMKFLFSICQASASVSSVPNFTWLSWEGLIFVLTGKKVENSKGYIVLTEP